MKWIFSKLTAVMLLSMIFPVLSADAAALSDSFIHPPDSAKPHTWWHWMNGNVTKAGITADLEAMAAVGIGGAQIFNVGDKASVNIPVGPVDYLSDEWLDLVHHAVREANRLGLKICLHNCAGWSSSGGPWITPDYAMKKVTVSETSVQGPGPVTVRLAQPATVRNYYRDIEVLAFPTPKDNTYRIPDAAAKAGFESQYGIRLEASNAPADAIIHSNSVIRLRSNMGSDGTLQWDCPEGEWTVLRIGYTITGKDNHPAPDSGLGLECDKLSREALDVHWREGIQPILDKLGDLAGPVMNNLLIDSYEVGINNWTTHFEKEFQTRRGYALTCYLPTLTGRVVDSSEVSQRFLWDYRRTISDLFTANYFGYFADKCHAAGLLCSTEPYDGPFECLSIGSKADILMGEFWVGGGVNPSVRIASSVAHVYGRQIVGAESFTSAPDQGRWQNHPRSMKALGDEIWCNGINRYIFHRYAHQPWLDQWPGMTMGQWGTHFERTNTWWKDGAAWMQYIARSQFLLQAGRFHADVLFFGGETVPNGAVYRPDLKAKGYDYDAVGTDLIQVLTVKEGNVVLPSGMSYSLLVMPPTHTMSASVAQKVRSLVESGATVLAGKPERSPSLTGYPDNDRQLTAIADAVWGKESAALLDRKVGKGRILSGYSVEQTLDRTGVRPDFETLSGNRRMNFIHRVIDGADVYFVSNQQDTAGTVRCAFRVTGKKPELWDSQRGRIEPAMLWQETDGRTEVTLPLEPEASVFVVFRDFVDSNTDSYTKIGRLSDTPVAALQHSPNTLEIVKAEYGVFSLEACKMADVTDKLNSLIRDNQLTVTADNRLAGDPAVNIRKQLLVNYTYAGKAYTVKVNEGQQVRLPQAELPAGKPLVVERAVYGDLPEPLVKMPKLKMVDVTQRLAGHVADGMLRARITNELAGGDPVVNVPKQIRVTYRLNGLEKVVTINENDMLAIPNRLWRPSPWPAEVHDSKQGDKLLAWDDGDYHLSTAKGKKLVATVRDSLEPIALKGPWAVGFESMVRPPKPIVLSEPASFSEHEDPSVKAFSGTAVYRKTFDLTDTMLSPTHLLSLDLGHVEVMARIIINGKDLGVLWKDPYRIDITDAVHAGQNQLEIRVTNLWVNRIIGDQAYEEDCSWQGSALAEWPEWLIKGQARPSKNRLTFYTWKHWGKDDPLMPSGLIGPVYIRVGQLVPIQEN